MGIAIREKQITEHVEVFNNFVQIYEVLLGLRADARLGKLGAVALAIGVAIDAQDIVLLTRLLKIELDARLVVRHRF